MLEIKNITAGYGKKAVIEDLSLKICKGKIIAVIGPNGSGKSTLLKAVSGIVPLMSGEVLADGLSVGNAKPRDIAKRISYLAQSRSTPDMTVEETVLHGRFPHLSYPRRYTENDRRAARLAMEKTGISDFSDRYMESLSGGMRQTVYIAMALCQDTDYILLDEPAVYLDISNQFRLMRLLKELCANGKGVMAVMHDLPTAFDSCDEIAVMNQGKCIMQDTPERICESGIIKELFGADIIKSQYGYIVKEKQS